MESHPDYVAIAENAIIIHTETGESSLFTDYNDTDVTVEMILKNKRFIPTASVLFRHNAIGEDINKVKKRFDTFMWSYLASKGCFYFQNKVSSVYRKGNQGITCYTDPYEWAKTMENYFLDLQKFFSKFVNKRTIHYNIYRQYLYAANKYVDMNDYGKRYWKSVLKGIKYRPLNAINNMGKYFLTHLIK